MGELDFAIVEAACVVYGFASKHPIMLPTQTVKNSAGVDCNYISIGQKESFLAKLLLGKVAGKGDCFRAAVTQVKKELHDQIDARRKEMLEIQLLGGQEAAAAAAVIDDTVNAVGVKACVYEFSTP